MDCDLDSQLTCPRCGYTAKRLGHKRRCRPPGMVAVGDAVAAGLAAVGITPKLVQQVTGVQDCGCKKRQSALNEAGFAIQRAVVEMVAGK